MNQKKFARLILGSRKFDKRGKRIDQLLDQVNILLEEARNEKDTEKFIQTMREIFPLMKEARRLQELNNRHTERQIKKVNWLQTHIKPLLEK